MQAGWPDEFSEKNRPKYKPNQFLPKLTFNFFVEKSSPKIGTTTVIFKELLNHPIGKNSPNLVTLHAEARGSQQC
jgi:hypothetical protein